MKVVYLKSFEKDIKKIKDPKLKSNLKIVLLELENVYSTDDLINLKKLKSHSNAFRIRIGTYRLGLYSTDKTLTVARFVKRNDIYKKFP